MTTPAMGLTLPVVGVTPGATAGTNIVDNFNIIDVHDHSSGKGVQVPAAGLNINAALSFGNQKAFNMSFLQLTSQVASPVGSNDRPNVHVLNGDLYYTNASGTAVQITNAGSISGTSGSIGGLASPASAQFATNTFSWKADATTFAKQSFSDLQIYPFNSGATNFLTLKVTNSVTTYTVTLPDAPPASTQPLGMTSGGNILAITYDSIGSGMTSTGANAIGASMTSTGANAVIDKYTRTTGTSVGARGVAISNGSGSFNTTSATLVDVTNLSVTITTSGRPVFLMIRPVTSTTAERDIRVNNSGTVTTLTVTGVIAFVRGSTVLTKHRLGLLYGDGASTGKQINFFTPASAYSYVDVVASGTYTYKVQAAGGAGGDEIITDNLELVAFEL